MTPHAHPLHVDGCFRCELSRDEVEALCPKHGEPWVVPDAPDGYRRCAFYLPELGASEDYGCPQP